MMKPLSWLVGKWRSESGKVTYPTMEDLNYIEELTFSHMGQPNLQFRYQSCLIKVMISQIIFPKFDVIGQYRGQKVIKT